MDDSGTGSALKVRQARFFSRASKKSMASSGGSSFFNWKLRESSACDSSSLMPLRRAHGGDQVTISTQGQRCTREESARSRYGKRPHLGDRNRQIGCGQSAYIVG